jgi:hypothetical protein
MKLHALYSRHKTQNAPNGFKAKSWGKIEHQNRDQQITKQTDVAIFLWNKVDAKVEGIMRK